MHPFTTLYECRININVVGQRGVIKEWSARMSSLCFRRIATLKMSFVELYDKMIDLLFRYSEVVCDQSMEDGCR